MGINIPGGWPLFLNFLFYFARIAKDARAWSGAISCFSGTARPCRICIVASSKHPQWKLLPSNLSVLKAFLIHPWPLMFLYLWLLHAVSCRPLQNLPCLCLPVMWSWFSQQGIESLACLLPCPAASVTLHGPCWVPVLGAARAWVWLMQQHFPLLPARPTSKKYLVSLWVLYKEGWMFSSSLYSSDACWKPHHMRTSFSIFLNWCPGHGTMMQSPVTLLISSTAGGSEQMFPILGVLTGLSLRSGHTTPTPISWNKPSIKAEVSDKFGLAQAVHCKS